MGLSQTLLKIALGGCIWLSAGILAAQEAEILNHYKTDEGDEMLHIRFSELRPQGQLKLNFEVADHSKFDLDHFEYGRQNQLHEQLTYYDHQEHKFPCARSSNGKVSLAFFAEYGDGGFSMPKVNVQTALEEVFQEPIAGMILGFRFGHTRSRYFNNRAEYGFCSFRVMRKQSVD